MVAKKSVNHINYVDEEGEIYCRKCKGLVHFNPEYQEVNCSKCPFFYGTAQGEGVECVWDDPRENIEGAVGVANPIDEFNELAECGEKQSLEEKLFIEKLANGTKRRKKDIDFEEEV